MSKIKLTGESSGYVEISAGDSAGNNTLEAPTSGTRLVAHEGTQNVSLGGRLNVSGITTFSDNVSIGAGATTAFFEVDTGNVGIGTDNPVENLVVSGNTNTTIRINNYDDSEATLYFHNTGTTDRKIVTANADMIFYGGTNEHVRIDSSGNLGIGTDNPIMRLHVHGAANSADSRIRLSSIEGSGLTIRAQSATENNINADSGEDITFSRGNVESLRITSSGLVGIGTDNPQTGLHIDSSSNAQSRITISKSGFLRNNFIGIDGDADELVIAVDESNEGSASHIKFKVDGTEELRIDSNGLKFNGDTAAANALDDYEQGTITTWRLKKDGANTSGSNHSDTHIRYTKIGQCVYVSGYLRTDSTQGSQSGNVLLVTVADATVAATLPFTPNHSGGIPIIHTRSIDELDHPISLAFVKDSATIYIYANESTGDYVADSNTLSTNSQTNIVITFSGHFFTDS